MTPIRRPPFQPTEFFVDQPPREDGTEPSPYGLPMMSLRDYFAAQVLDQASHDLTEPEIVAHRAYAIADAMLAERRKP